MRAAVVAVVALTAVCAVHGARAQDDVTVFSTGAESVSITIYRDNLALVTEARTVELPAGPVRLVLEDVADTLLPQSAVLNDIGGPLAETDYDAARLTTESLMQRSIGANVTIVRTNSATGRVERLPATIVAVGDNQVMFEAADGTETLHCAGLPERLELERVPDGLLAKPRLSVRLAAGAPGRRTFEVSYLAHGFSWSADYVAHLDERGERMRLAGWATLVNESGTAFREVQVQLVAGRLQILPQAQGGSRVRRNVVYGSDEIVGIRPIRPGGCYAGPERRAVRVRTDEYFRAQPGSGAALDMIPSILVTRLTEREELGDYQLYRIPWRTDLNARQTKQVRFLDKPDVRVERYYSYRIPQFAVDPGDDPTAPSLVVRFENAAAHGLGEPMPRGTLRVFAPQGATSIFAGEAAIDDSAVGAPVEAAIARALDLALEITLEAQHDDEPLGQRTTVSTRIGIANGKSAPADLEIRHAVSSRNRDLRVESSSHPDTRKHGDVAWRFTVAPGEETLSYRLSAR